MFRFVLKTNRNKSEQIGAFPKTRSANRNKSEEIGEIGTDRGDPLLLTTTRGSETRDRNLRLSALSPLDVFFSPVDIFAFSPGFLCSLSAAFYAAYGFTGAFGRNLCKFTFPQRRRNLRKSLLKTTRPTGVKRAKKWLR